MQRERELLERGLLAQKKGDLAQAEQFYRQALRANRQSADALHLIATVLAAREQYPESAAQFVRAICLSPSEAIFLNNFRRLRPKWSGGDARRHLWLTAWLQRLQPQDVEINRDLAVSCHELGDMRGAQCAYTRAYLLAPEQLSLAVSAALCALQRGDFAFGWRWHEWRLREPKALSPHFGYGRLQAARSLDRNGSADGVRRRVLVWAEQGVGDEVMFGSLLREFRGRCGELLVQLDPRLRGLFERSMPGVRFFDRGTVVDESLYDEQIPLGSLAQYLRPNRESFAGRGGAYLAAKPALREHFRARMNLKANERVIGLSWKSAAPETGAARSLALEDLLTACRDVSNLRFVNLQYGDVATDLERVKAQLGIEVYHESEVDNRNDLEGLAGLIDACDEIISVGNATAHLAGALGKKTLVLLPFVAGWRWLHEGERCPWYESVTLLRQTTAGDWAAALEAIACALSCTTPSRVASPSLLARVPRAAQASLVQQPDRAAWLFNLGNECLTLEALREATRWYRRALALQPEFFEPTLNLGVALLRQQQHTAATRQFLKTLLLRPESIAGYLNALDCGVATRDFAFVRRLARAANALAPTDANLQLKLASALLSAGEFASGWRLYESRWRSSVNAALIQEFAALRASRPSYRDRHTSQRRRVLVWAEQGVGDEVMFGGLLQEFRTHCGEMLVQLDPRLRRLFERSFPGIKFFDRGVPVDEELYDEQIPLGSLAQYLRPSRESFEKQGRAYLTAKPGLREYFRNRMNLKPHERVIGLSWRSSAVGTGAARSLALEDLLAAVTARTEGARGRPPAAIQRLHFVNLQYGDVAAELERAKTRFGIEVYHESEVDNRHDLEGLAGLIDACDEIISIGNATAHLAGALGKSSLVLLPRVAGWRWLHEGERCLWYDCVTLWRQTETGEWSAVLRQLAEAYAAADNAAYEPAYAAPATSGTPVMGQNS